MMLLNYVFVITILPATAFVVDIKPKPYKISRSEQFLITKREQFIEKVDLLFDKYIPDIIEHIRIPLIPLALVALALSVYSIIKNPGIRLPETNSLQVF